MTGLYGLQLKLTPSQYLGASLLALLLAVSALFGKGQESQVKLTRTPVQEISATSNQAPATATDTAPSDQLPALLALNRQAAARVALIGLTRGAGRGALARSAADWMGRAVASMLQTGDEFAARQRAILVQWQTALGEYVDGSIGSLARVQAVSNANAELYAEMVKINEDQKEF